LTSKAASPLTVPDLRLASSGPATGGAIAAAAITAVAFAFAGSIPGVAASRRPLANFEIRVSGATPVDTQIWLRRLIIDGRLRRFDSTVTSDGWIPVAKLGGGVPPVLQRKPESGTSTLRFSGRSFVLVAEANPSRGSMQLVRNSVVTRTVELQPTTGVFALDDVDSHVRVLACVLALLLGGAVTWRLRPWERTSRATLWLAGVLSSVHLLVWIGQCIGTTNDSAGYVSGAAALMEGSPAYFPPGYPMLLGLLDGVSGVYLGNAVTLVQHAMMVAAGVWTYLLLRRLVCDRAALCGGLLAGALPPVLTMAQSIMSEPTALFAMSGAIYFAVRAVETGRVRFAVIGGALAGWAGLIRVVPLAGLIPALGAIFLLPWAARRPSLLAAAGGALITVLLVPMIWFGLRSGDPVLADSAGFHLYNRVVTEQRLLDPGGATTRQLIGLLGADDPRRMTWWEVRAHARVSDLRYDVQERLLRGVAMEAIRAHPVAFAAFVPRLAVRELFAESAPWIPSWPDALSPTIAIESPAILPLTAAAVRSRWDAEAVQRFLWPVLAGLSFAGVLVGLRLPQRGLVLALVLVPAGYLVATASLDYFAARHNVPVTPFVVALAVLPTAWIGRRRSAADEAVTSTRQASAGGLHRDVTRASEPAPKEPGR